MAWEAYRRNGKALYDFAPNGDYQVPLKAGDRVEVTEQSSGWYKGTVMAAGGNLKGIFPASFVQLSPELPPEDTPAAQKKLEAIAQKKKELQEKARQVEAAAQARTKVFKPTRSATKDRLPAFSANGSPSTATSNATTKGGAKITLASSGSKITLTTSAASKPKPPPPSSGAPRTYQPKAKPRPPPPKGPVPAQATSSMSAASLLESKDDEERFVASDLSIEALMKEIEHCMVEWTSSLQDQLKTGNSSEYHKIKERMSSLLELRKNTITERNEDKREELRDSIVRLIEGSRKAQEGFMVPRNAGQKADTSNTNIMKLLDLHHDMHAKASEETSSAFRAQKQRRRTQSIAVRSQAPGASLKASPMPPGPLQLILKVEMCIFKAGDATDILISLYSKAKDRFITEPFAVCITAAGLAENLDLIGKQNTMLKDLDAADFQSGLYLVAFVYRRGMIGSDKDKRKKKKDPKVKYRSPYGCAVLDLTSLRLETKLVEHKDVPPVMIYTTREKDESSFTSMHKALMDGNKAEYPPAPEAKGIVMGLRLVPGDEDKVRSMGMLGNSKDRNKQIDLTDIPVTNKLNLPEVMSASESRNDFYVWLLFGQFNQDRKTVGKNIRVGIRVKDDSGKTIPNCIRRAAGPAVQLETVFESSIYYHNNQPRWNELLLLQIEPSQFDRCHLFITFTHISNNKKNQDPFAFGFFKLTTPSGAVVPDQEHNIPSFAVKKIKDIEAGCSYLRGDMAVPKLVPRAPECVTIATKLSSTKKTQHETLHSIFKWRRMNHPVLRQMLLTFVKRINRGTLRELAKFVRETFDVFFAILDSAAHKDLHMFVFDALVHGLSLLTGKTISQYRPIVDSYLESIFNFPQAHRVMLQLATAKFEEQKELDDSVSKMCKTMDYVLKVICRSRQIEMATEAKDQQAGNKPAFESAISALFASMCNLVGRQNVASKQRHLITTSYIVKGFPKLTEVLQDYGLFQPLQIGVLAKQMIEAILPEKNSNVAKLNLIRFLMNGEVGTQKESRETLFPVIVRSLKTHLRNIDASGLTEPYLCVAVLKRIVAIAPLETKNNVITVAPDFVSQILPVLPDLVHVLSLVQRQHLGTLDYALKPPTDTVKQQTKIDMLRDSSTIVFNILHGLNQGLLSSFLSSMRPPQQAEFLRSLLQCLLNSLSIKPYEDLWIVMNMVELSVMAHVLEHVKSVLKGTLGPNSKHFSPAVWRAWFHLALAMLGTERLALEKFSAAKTEFITSRYGDVRESLVGHVNECWNFLGKEKLKFVGDITAKLFNLAQNCTMKQAKNMALDIYDDMITHEITTTKEYSVVERYTIDALYDIANISQLQGDKFMDFIFNTMKLRIQENAAIKEQGQMFLEHVQKLYELMSQLIKFPNNAVYEDDRTSVALQLMRYLDDTGHVRKEMSSRYVQELVNLHVGLGNFVEAGMTLLSQIRLLEWTNETIDKIGMFNAQPECERKEHLCALAVEYFSKGQDWERAIDISTVLREYYEKVIYDYGKLSKQLQEEAKFFAHIKDNPRVYANYYCVSFLGKAFDEDVRGKTFIYRGKTLEPLTDFKNRFMKKYNKAVISKTSDDTEMQDGFVVTLFIVKPEHYQSFDELPNFDLPTHKQGDDEKKQQSGAPPPLPGTLKPLRDPPQNVVTYRSNNNLSIFSNKKPFRKTAKNKADQWDEFKGLWTKTTFYQVEESFPTNRRRVPVKAIKVCEMSPLVNGANSVEEKTQDLKAKIAAVEKADEQGLPVDGTNLLMTLKGIAMAGVNGGPMVYVQSFCTPEFEESIKDDPNAKIALRALKDGLREQTAPLLPGWELVGRHIQSVLKDLHKEMKSHIIEMTERVFDRTK